MEEEKYKEHLKKLKPIIQGRFYFFIKLIIEQYYTIEGNMNPYNSQSTTLIFKKDKHHIAQEVAKEIKKFAQEHQAEVQDVKDILLEAIQADIQKEIDKMERRKKGEEGEAYQAEYEQVKEIVLEEER